jgi:protein-S-isoprenylcysteine O-methyltransferase Ste14
VQDDIIRATLVIASFGLVALPAFAHRGRTAAAVAKSGKGVVEKLALMLSALGFVLPLIWAFTPFLAIADHAGSWIGYPGGLVCYAAGLALLYRCHHSLGESWSISLEVREGHRLVTQGIYSRVRHPMYLALLLYGLGQALVVPNWIAGPSYLVAACVLIAVRLGPEERMMRDEFTDYEAYRGRTARLIPGVW